MTVETNGITGQNQRIGNMSVYAASDTQKDPYVYVNDPDFNKPDSEAPNGKHYTLLILKLIHAGKS